MDRITHYGQQNLTLLHIQSPFQVINFFTKRGFFLMHDALPRSAQIPKKGEDKWVFVYMVKRDRKRRDKYGE